MKKVTRKKLFENDPRWNYGTFKQRLFNILDKHEINYTLRKDHDKQRECYMFGLSGVRDMSWLFNNNEKLEAFLFDPKSGFTFGRENDWPSSAKVGYTDIDTDYIADKPIYHVTLI